MTDREVDAPDDLARALAGDPEFEAAVAFVARAIDDAFAACEAQGKALRANLARSLATTHATARGMADDGDEPVIIRSALSGLVVDSFEGGTLTEATRDRLHDAYAQVIEDAIAGRAPGPVPSPFVPEDFGLDEDNAFPFLPEAVAAAANGASRPALAGGWPG